MDKITNINNCWQECLARLRSEIPHAQYTTWLIPLECIVAENEDIIIRAYAKKIWQFVKENYWEKISKTFIEFALPQPQLQFYRPEPVSAAESKMNVNQINAFSRKLEAEKYSLFSEQANSNSNLLPESIDIPLNEINEIEPFQQQPQISNYSNRANNGLQEHYTFESFVVGNSNQLAYSAALKVSEKPGLAYNPFYLYGGVGIGKTHLAHAIGNSLQNKLGYKVRYIHADDYFNEVAKTMRNQSHEEFKKAFRYLDAFIIDDVQFLQNRTRTQEELFYLFNALMETGRQIIVTSDRFPRDIENLQERLRSRFQWGLTVAIDSPEIELRVAILQRKAQLENIELDTASSYYIAKHLKANVRELEGALNKVIAYTSFHNLPITSDTVRLALKDIIGQISQPLTLEHIQKTVADFYKINISELHSKSRARDLVRARQVAMWLTRELTTISLPSIGNAFGGRDHTTVIHAYKTVEELRKVTKFNQELRYLEQILKGD